MLKRSNEINNLSNIVQTCECCIAVLAGHENVGVSRVYERGFQQVHQYGARKAKKGPVNLWRANFTSNTLLHYLIMLVPTLYIKYMLSANWTFCCTGNKAFTKVYQWFYWTSNPQFSAYPWGHKAVLFCLASFLLRGPGCESAYKSEWWTDNQHYYVPFHLQSANLWTL